MKWERRRRVCAASRPDERGFEWGELFARDSIADAARSPGTADGAIHHGESASDRRITCALDPAANRAGKLLSPPAAHPIVYPAGICFQCRRAYDARGSFSAMRISHPAARSYPSLYLFVVAVFLFTVDTWIRVFTKLNLSLGRLKRRY